MIGAALLPNKRWLTRLQVDSTIFPAESGSSSRQLDQSDTPKYKRVNIYHQYSASQNTDFTWDWKKSDSWPRKKWANRDFLPWSKRANHRLSSCYNPTLQVMKVDEKYSYNFLSSRLLLVLPSHKSFRFRCHVTAGNILILMSIDISSHGSYTISLE